MPYAPNTFHRAPREQRPAADGFVPEVRRAEAPTCYGRLTTGRANGGRSLKPETLARYRQAVALTRLLAGLFPEVRR